MKLQRWATGLGLVMALWLSACGGGGNDSSPAASQAPGISTPPQPVMVYAGDLAAFNVAASGAGALTYQWRQDGLNVAGAVNPRYNFTTTLADHGKQISVVVSNSHGSTASANALLSVLPAEVSIATSPSDQSVDEGLTATFTVKVGGKPDFAYQWTKNGADIQGATAAVYTTPVTTPVDNGAKFSVRVANDSSTVVSESATLTVTGSLPNIITQPVTQSVGMGQTAVFTVAATGRPAPTYQWRKNGMDILGANAAIYTTPPVQAGDHNARFSVHVINGFGWVTSTDALLEISGGVNAATACAVTNTSSANEPLFSRLWHIKNANSYFASVLPGIGAGLDLCMGGLWAAGTNGNGVKVTVVDEGLELAHEDLSARIIAGGSFNFVDASADPTNPASDGDHGTSVAGLIAATKDNGKGGAGVAPSSSLQGYNYLLSQSPANLAIAFGANASFGAKNSDIFNYSAGSVSPSLSTPTSATDTTLGNMATLRAGKGAVFIKSAGNGFGGLSPSAPGDPTNCRLSGVTCQNVNQDRSNTLYNTIVVAALGADGSKSSYSTTGSAIWVSGFGGEYGYDSAVTGTGYIAAAYKPALLTTDQSGCHQGYSSTGINKNQLDKGDGSGIQNANCNYTAGFNGTSSAAPTVSGVVALMLQAKPALTWRDVRHILATTSRRVSPTQAAITNTTYFPGTTLTLEQGWVLNKAGYWYHNWYGFGLVNAAAAVAMAQTHTAGSLGTFVSETKTAALAGTTINTGASGLTKTFAVAGSAPATVEQAELTLHFGSGYQPTCHQIELTSPQGTKSIVLNMDSAHTGASTAGVRFMSNAFYGEKAAGNWTLRFINSCAAQNLSATVAQQLTIRGR